MSLSKPNSPVFITEGVASDVQPVSNLDSNSNATLINQLHAINTTNAIGAGIPKQVSNVQVSVANAQTGSTCTVTVLYRIDPTDKNFAGVNILVKGYQGNNQLVQVSSGVSSPTKFVLNNTGEIVSFTVQAYGNGGSAPLTGSPTCSGTLPQATGGGFGSSTNTSASVKLQHNFVDNASQSLLNIESIDSSILISNPSGGNLAIQGPQFNTVNPGWWGSGEGSNYPAVTSATGRWGTGTANQVKCWMVRIPYTLKVTKLTTRTGGPLALSTSSFACYDSTGTHKLFAFEGFVTTTTGVTLTHTLGATVTLPPGIYIMACSCDTSGTPPTTLGGYTATGSNEGVEPWNTNGTVRSGTAANPSVATVLPATLGALSPGGSNYDPLPLWIMEP